MKGQKLLASAFLFVYLLENQVNFIVGIVSKETPLRRRANARNVSTSFLPYGGITYFINSFDYPNLLNFIVAG